MDEQAVPLALGYFGLLVPAAIGFWWTDDWLYNKRGAARHWLYAVVLLVPVVILAFLFREAYPRGTFFAATLLPLLGCAVGAVLGAMFGQFFEHPKQEDKTS